ncbi:Na+/solute symporter [Rhodomicrobium vannielii ATCC 17100]|uniref:Na+/solute symporter n=1 Tax=Rhodomicrobium vannielii (strain ATCC 17100 / DSM 162 / LMG 4299 / NCIMB 10020 / ATH 3.1.1) TaxID=648757 RepID=E3I112_RHOVT|nr:Na+/solute symporter [Rhodomicrobium vannielii]ADP72335.1 Na+/solute symporter [Rhodomicrobium vannielii ATCC 17100]
MTLNYSTPAVNPKLGSSFAIFASAYTCLVLMLVVLEQLGLSTLTIDHVIVVAPALFYIAIGFMTRTIAVDDFFVAGERVPPLYNALALNAMVFGGSLLAGSIAAFFFIGIDAIAIPVGLFAGLVLMAVLFVPHLRKAGAYTVPGFLHLRFGRKTIRLTASVLMIAPCLIAIVAEVALGGNIVGYLLPTPQALGIDLSPASLFTLLVVASIVIAVVLGGMRAATWTQCAQFVVVLGLVAPLIVVSVIRTNLPLPQLTYGGQLEEIKEREASKGFITTTRPKTLSEVLPGQGAQPVTRPAERMFSALSPFDFVLLIFCLAVGVASHPTFLPRLSTTPTILASRRMFGWVTMIGAFVVLTIPAYAFFTKAMAVEALIGVPVSDLPAWARALQQLGFISLPGNQFEQLGGAQRVTFQPDSLALILPMAGQLPRVFFGLAAAALLAAIAACAAGHLVALANTVSDDIYHGTLRRNASPARRLLVARLSMIVFGIFVYFLAQGHVDPLRWAMVSLSLAAGTFFAVLVLSVWWRRLSAKGALAGMVTGFAVTALYLNASGAPLFGIDSLNAAAIGVPVSFVSAAIVSLLFGTPDAHALEAVEDLRVPAGETLQSRMVRLASRTKPTL